jgi:hypothetical protein
LSGLKNDIQRVSIHRRSSSFFARTALVVILVLGFGSLALTPINGPSIADSTASVSRSQAIAPANVSSDVPPDASPEAAAPVDPQIEETTHQETSASLEYTGDWSSAEHSDYLAGRALWSTERGASASLTFTGVGISWIGPTGPTRGKAKIYVDGRYVKTVDTYAGRFDPSRVLYSTSYMTQKPRTIKIVVVGTRNHPMVAIDALVVRAEVTAAADAPPTAPPEATPAPTAESTPDGTSGATPSATPSPAPLTTPQPVPTPLATPFPTPSPLPMNPALPAGTSVKVTTIPALLDALANNTVTDIVVANGTYRVSPAGRQESNSLWIGSRFASRSNPVTVRAETRGGVTFDGGGASYFGGLSFEAGAHHQTWDGFQFANGKATDTGVVTFGGYAGLAAPHHITLRHIAILGSCAGRATGIAGNSTDHAIYMSQAVGGPHDLLLEDITVDGSGYLASALHFYHSDGANQNAWNVTVRRLTVNKTQQAIILWDRTVHDVTFDGATITNALAIAVRYEGPGSNIAFRNITTTGSGQYGFYSSLGANPPGVTFSGNSFD